jgi:hypothetical protein
MTLDIKILIDQREKLPWVFNCEEEIKKGYKTHIIGSESVLLDAADYTIKGYEDLIAVERKAGFCELFGNLTPVAHKDRFEREMVKLAKVRFKYLIVESSLSLDIMGMSLQNFKYPLPVSRIISWIYDLQRDYGIVPIFAGNAGQKMCRKLFEDTIRKYG